MKLWGQIVVTGIILGAGAAGYMYRDQLPFIGTGAQPTAARPAATAPVIPVETQPVRRMDMARTMEAVGTAQSNEAVTITAKGNGTIERINFQEGQIVKSGVVLVELEAGESSAKLAELRAARDAARLAYERAASLLDTKNVAQARVDELSKAFEAAEARLRGEQAKFSDSVIRAPFSGRLGMRRVSLGALVKPGDAITTLDDTSVIKLEFDVPETVLSGIAQGSAVSAKATSMPNRKFEGTVSTVDTRIDPTKRAIRVRANIPNADNSLKPGMFMTVTLNMGKVTDAMVVPEESLLAQGGEQFVFVIRDGRASRTRVTIGQRLPGVVQITSGLRPDDQVAVTGLQQLRDGSRVRQTNAPATPAPGATAQKTAS